MTCSVTFTCHRFPIWKCICIKKKLITKTGLLLPPPYLPPPPVHVSVIQSVLFCLHSLDVSTAASRVAVGTATGRVILLNLANLHSENGIEPGRDHGPVRVVRFNKDGQLLVTGHDTGVIEVICSWEIVNSLNPLNNTFVPTTEWL